MALGKKYKAALAKVDRNRRYKVDEAMKLVKDTAARAAWVPPDLEGPY